MSAAAVCTLEPTLYTRPASNDPSQRLLLRIPPRTRPPQPSLAVRQPSMLKSGARPLVVVSDLLDLHHHQHAQYMSSRAQLVNVSPPLAPTAYPGYYTQQGVPARTGAEFNRSTHVTIPLQLASASTHARPTNPVCAPRTTCSPPAVRIATTAMVHMRAWPKHPADASPRLLPLNMAPRGPVPLSMGKCAPCMPQSPPGSAEARPNVLIEFDLLTKVWHEMDCGRPCIQWKDFKHPLNYNMLQSIKVTGRHSYEDKRGKAKAEQILSSPEWSITDKTNLEDVENLVVLLVKCLDTWTSKIEVGGEVFSWCVGGSLAETINSRTKDGSSSTLRFVACSRSTWVGNNKSKISNTCSGHCAGLHFKNVLINNQFRREIVLRKCTWLKCCYGKKPYGAPPFIPWVPQCEYQKKMVRAARALEAGDGHVSVAGPPNDWRQRPPAAVRAEPNNSFTSNAMTANANVHAQQWQTATARPAVSAPRIPTRDARTAATLQATAVQAQTDMDDARLVVTQLLSMGDFRPESDAVPTLQHKTEVVPTSFKRASSYLDVRSAVDALQHPSPERQPGSPLAGVVPVAKRSRAGGQYLFN